MDSDLGKLFIGGISWETDESKLKDYFSVYGEVSDAVIMRDRATGRARGFGFVVFADPSMADRVLQEKHVIDGRTVEAKKAVPRDEQQNLPRSNGGSSPAAFTKTKKIFVGGLSSNVTEEEFKKYFEQFGTITDVVVMYDHTTQRPRGFGFITFDTEEAVDNVLQKSFHELSGKMVEVKRAVPKELSQGPSRSPGAGFGSPVGRGGYGGGYGQSYNSSPSAGYGGRPSPGGRGYPTYGAGYAGAGYGSGGYGSMNGSYGGAYGNGAMYGSGAYGGGYGGAPGGYAAGGAGYAGPASGGYGAAPGPIGGRGGWAAAASPVGYGAGGGGNISGYGSGWSSGAGAGQPPASSGGYAGSGYGGSGYSYGGNDSGYPSNAANFASRGGSYGNSAAGYGGAGSGGAGGASYGGGYGDGYGSSGYPDNTWKSGSAEPYGAAPASGVSGGGAYGLGVAGMTSDGASNVATGYSGGYGVSSRQVQRGPDARFRPYPAAGDHTG